MHIADTIVAAATPPGIGAVAVVRLSGPRAIEIIRRIWQSASSNELVPRRLHLGDIRDPATGAAIDRALAVIMPAPASLTGEDVAELQCHGGPFLVRRVVALAMAQGARLADPGEFTRRAFLNGRLDLTEAEAVADLVEARGEGALRQALQQLDGALANRVGKLRNEVISIRAHLEVEIDFSDEGLKLPSRDQIAAEIEKVSADVAILHDSFARGRLMREGARAAIIGKPNVGKSSLLNVLLGVERAIVTAIPGTTRDVVEDSVLLGPYSLVLQDTAGVRKPGDPVEELGVERTLSHAASADLVIAVFDSSAPLDAEDRRVIDLCRDRHSLGLLNKQDLPARLSAEDLHQSGLEAPTVGCSALLGNGISKVRSEIQAAVDVLSSCQLDRAGDVSISRERHRDALARALEALSAARASALDAMPPEIVAVDIALAADSLGVITGEVTTEDVLDRVFRDFCIGK